MIGRTFSHYRILEHIGGGGMGVVYKAEDIRLNRPVALKFLPPEFSRDPEAKKRFLLEARTYRFVGHSRSDPGKYRPEGELERWRERDPLLVAAARLRGDGLPEQRLDELAADVEAELAAIEQSALAAPFPQPAALSEFNDGA